MVEDGVDSIDGAQEASICQLMCAELKVLQGSITPEADVVFAGPMTEVVGEDGAIKSEEGEVLLDKCDGCA